MIMNTSPGTFIQLISYFLLWFEVTFASIRYGRLVHKAEDFDDRLLTLDAKWTHEVTSLINCVSICSLDERCASVQFHQAATICAGYVVNSASRPASVSSPGYVTFDMERPSQTFGSSCSDDSECTFTRHTSCVAGSCKCSTSRTGDECEGVDTTQTATAASGIQTTSLDQTQATTVEVTTTAAAPTTAAATQITTTTTPTTATTTPTTTTTTPSTSSAKLTTTIETHTTATTTPTTTTTTPTTSSAKPTTATAKPTTATETPTTPIATTSMLTTTTSAVQTTSVSGCTSCTVIPGITCTTNTDCIEPNAVCQGGTCVCPAGTTLVSRGTLYICEYAQPTCGNCAGLADSACEGGLCVCSIGYNYNPVTNACDGVEKCAAFLDTFTLYSATFSFFSEDERRPVTSLQQCLDMCVTSTTITCKNFEVAPVVVPICYLHQTTWFEFPTSVRHIGGFNHYQRNCDWKAVTVGTACRDTVDCSPLTNADCMAGKCACNTGTRLVPRVNKCLKFQVYGESCSADSDCYSLLEAFCLSGVCTCRHGYSYSSAGQYCRDLTECTTFKDTFTTYPESVIYVQDIASFGSSNPTMCIQKCIESVILCKSAELSTVAVCFLSGVTWREAITDTASFDTIYTHFQRDCDWS